MVVICGFQSKVTPCLDVVRLDSQRCLGYVEELNILKYQSVLNLKGKLIFLHSQKMEWYFVA